jgi:cardiolipin synthase
MRRRIVWTAGILALVSVPIVLFALVGLPHVFRNPLVRDVMTHGARDAPLSIASAGFAAQLSLLTGAPASPGNKVEVLADGDGTFPPLWRDLRLARRSITVQMYYAGPGQVADTATSALMERARAGADVYFLYDAFGAQDLPARYLDSMRAAGVRVAEFRPLRWYALDRASHRSHVRGIVIDGATAYTGGFGFDDKWLGGGHLPREWREINTRFTGPAVMQLQAGFIEKWAEATGDLLTGDSFLPDGAASSDVGSDGEASVVASAPISGSTAAERLFAAAIAGAQRTLYITSAYFVPQADFIQLMIDAKHRGVDVRVLTNSAQSDVKTTWLAGRSQYEILLAGGVRIYEYQPGTLHAKTLVADGVLSSIGTMNFDNRSLAYNDEVALVTLDRKTGKTMDSLFADDLRSAQEIRLATFLRRGWTSRVLERAARMLATLL